MGFRDLEVELAAMTSNNEITPEAYAKICKLDKQIDEETILEKIKKLEQMVKEWEATMGEEDKTFYTLGLRRAIDVLADNDPDILKQLPILEKEDTPNER